jgi:hypothetical protein
MLKIIAILFFSFEVWAVMFLDIELTHEKGLGKEMILKSELMSTERIQSGKSVTLKMKNGIEVELKAKFSEKDEELGPSSFVELEGTLNNSKNSDKEKTFKLNVKINEIGKLELKDDQGQRTTIKVTPKVK